MLKRTVFASLAALAISSPALAIEIPSDADVGFIGAATAYPSSSFNKILEACGLSMSADAVAGVPATYARAMDGNVSFNDNNKAYTPMQYHSIFTAYGLELSPEKASAMDVPSYATVKDGNIAFGGSNIAFNGGQWTSILAAYELPPEPVVMMVMDADGDGVEDERDLCPNTPKGVIVNDDGCWIYATDFLFDFDKATLKEEFHHILDGTREVFDLNPDLEVRVEGHADSTGPEAYNQKLSERRAQAVVDYLVNSVGVAEDRLSAVGYGETKPAYPNDTEENRAKNRRVQFVPNKK